MKHVSLDTQHENVKQFVLSLPLDDDGSVLELGGRPVARVLAVRDEEELDAEKLKAAILARRDESRGLNREWEDVDRQQWDGIQDE
ncbi:MAG: hypothetical protein HYS13_25920 [Planctomycetia bacterium]|nr:hypothetical protein [Planctomycetia bacterium]